MIVTQPFPFNSAMLILLGQLDKTNEIHPNWKELKLSLQIT